MRSRGTIARPKHVTVAALMRRHALSTKLVSIGAVMFIVALASIGSTLWVTWQLEGGAAAVNEAGRLRMQTWRLASVAQSDTAAQRLPELVQLYDGSLELLRNGDGRRPLFMPSDTTVQSSFARVQSLWLQTRPLWQEGQFTDADASLQVTTKTVEAVDQLVTAIERQLSRLTAVLNLFQFVMMVLAIAGAIMMLYIGYLYVINPLDNLQQGLQRIQRGDFAARIDPVTDDEFGHVARGFNGMAHELQTLYTGLEAQVQAKTRDIEAQRARLQTLYEISGFTARASTVGELSQGFAQRVRVIMNADGVALRWSDEASQRYLLLASDCLPAIIQDEERSLVPGSCYCGNLQREPHPRVIPIVDSGDRPPSPCVRAGYETMISVPVLLQQRTLGEINLFYRSAAQPRADEMELLEALGSHLANGLESLRAAALEREAAVGEERALLARELHDSIAQSLAFLKIQVQLLRSAEQRGQPADVALALDELDTGLRESINDVRELLMHFRTRTNTQDFETALQETIQKFRHQTNLATHLSVEGDGLPLPADVQVQVLHIVQEALSNARKHARARRVDLSVRKDPYWCIEIADDGVGFDANATDRSSTHVGLKIMRERAQRIGAQVSLQSDPGKGTRVLLQLPEHPHDILRAPADETADSVQANALS